jgi:hypothetical protein
MSASRAASDLCPLGAIDESPARSITPPEAAKTATKRAFWLRLEVATRIEEIQALNFSRAGYQTVVLTNSRALK